MKRQSKLCYYVLFVTIVIALTACKPPMTETPTSVVSPLPSTSPLPKQSAQPLVYPTSTSGNATVLGTLFVMDPMIGGPKNGDSIYLVPMPEAPPSGLIVAPEVDPENAHKVTAIDRENGQFVFTNIPPGDYHILVVTPMGTIPVRSMDTGRIQFPTLLVDQVLDLGHVQIP